MSSLTSVEINSKRMEMGILRTKYAGEMHLLGHALPPAHHVQPALLPLGQCRHGKRGCRLPFFLSGTGKTTMSADPRRLFILTDEHAWSDSGIFTIKGGCYAKSINLSREKEPEI